MTIDLARLLDIATLAALAGGTELKRFWGNLQEVQEKGRPGDLVTEADRAAEKAVLQVLHRHVPDHAILSEEAGALGDLSGKFLWAIDPLDGTTNYAHQYPFFAVSVGLLIAGVPQVGVVYNPIYDELYQAATGMGATLNQQPIQVSAVQELSKSLLVTGFAYDRTQTTDTNYPEFCHFTHKTQGVRRDGAASLDLAYVAAGRVEAYWERGLSPWDQVAGIVLVQEAGGKVSSYDGNVLDLQSGRILASNGHLHGVISQELLQVTATR
ncbi:MAG: inositol monophosphatase family protein [Synechococcales bacterium]|nr:inositol monophosphatase family protein [Synechococcales bacterium]